jgi:putative component of membrane protein insertase Oxa1/YidC/SpoIIIJ protein YidD
MNQIEDKKKAYQYQVQRYKTNMSCELGILCRDVPTQTYYILQVLQESDRGLSFFFFFLFMITVLSSNLIRLELL